MSTAATTSSPHTKFPTHGLLPRADTQAADFVRKHPTYDGRGTVVAILDTGIDPGAQGLQVTSDGKRKIVDFVDCTGAGDVHLTAAARPLNGELKGASGRQLKVNAQWPNPTGEWRVGTKRLYDLIPEPLVARVREEREASFKKAAQRLSDSVASAQSAAEDDEAKAELGAQEGVLKSLSASYADPGPLLDCVVFHDGNQWRAAIDTEETGDLRQAEALGAYKLTGDVGKLCKRQLFYYTLNFYNEGGVLSIVTNVGSHSTHVAGILAANHPDEPQNNGVAPGAQLLSLMIGDHRVGSLETGVGLTRAASAIVEHSADLANMSYGEPSATSNAGQWVQMVRREVVRRHRCIFVSSAGNEGPALSTAGAPGGTSDDIIGVGAYVGYEQIKAEYAMYDTVKDTVFTWCSRGPTTDGARGVDIYAPGSAIASFPAYTLQRLQLGNGTSMSSPNLCGCLALLVSAWKQEFAKQSEQKISPYRVKNAIIATAKPFGGDDLGAGLVQTDAAWAFLKKHAQRSYEDIEYAVRIGELDNARGIYLRNAEDSAVARHLTVTVAPVFPGDARAELDNDRGGEHGELQSQRKFDFEQRVILTASESWVRVPEALYVSSDGRSFSVKVDATQLEPGRLHVAEIKGYDSRDVDRGEIFSIPITVTKPLGVDSSACVRFPQLRFQPTETTRRFIAVPQGATKAWITIRAANASPASSAPASFYLHCLQLAPQHRFTQYELKTRVSIGHATYVAGAGSAEQSYVKSMDVVGGRTLEVCIAPFWNQLDVHEIDVSVEFNGIIPSGAGAPAYSGDSGLVPGVVLNGNTTIARVDFTAPVRPEYDFKPVATLDTLRTALRPISSSIAPLLAERDTHLESGVAIQKLVLDYKYATQADKTTVRLRLPAVDSMIYENWADDFALYVFDANKKRVAAQISYTAPLTLDKKGDYLIRVQVRHRSAKDLEALKSAPLLVDTTLAAKVSLSGHASHAVAFTDTVQGVRAIAPAVRKGDSVPVFFKTAVASLPKEAAPGDVLRGSLALSKRTAKLLLEYVVPAKEEDEKKSGKNGGAASAASDSKKPGEERKPEEKKETEEKEDKEKEEKAADKDRKDLEAAIRKLRIDWVKKVKDDAVRAELVSELLASQASADEAEAEADKAAVLSAQLETLDKAHKTLPWSEQAKFTEESATKAVDIADAIVSLTYSRALTAKLYQNQAKATPPPSNGGVKKEDEEEKKQKEGAELAKKQLISALTTKCRSLAFLATQSSFPSTQSEASAEFVDVAAEAAEEKKLLAYEAATKELTRWTGENAQDPAHLAATLPLHVAKQQYGRALKPVVEWLAKAPLTEANAAERKAMAELRDQLLEKLQWTLWADHLKTLALVENPESYAQF